MSSISEEDARADETIAAWNESIATGECTGPKNTVVPCSMMTHVVAMQTSPAAPSTSDVVWGVQLDGGPWELHRATPTWGVPQTPFYDGTSISNYSTDAAVSYVRRDTFVVTAIADAPTGIAHGAVLVYTTDAGKTWSMPTWTHRGCDVLGSTQGPTPATFWNAKQQIVAVADDGSSDPVVVTEVGHYACCPGQPGGPPADPHTVCGGYFAETAEFGAFTLSGNPQFNPATTLYGEQDGYERGSTQYLAFATLMDDDKCWDLVAEYPVTTDGEGALSNKGSASYLGGDCPSGDTFDVRWRTQFTRMCLGALGQFADWKHGPEVDRDPKSPMCIGDSKHLNSWLPTMGVLPDRKWVGTAVSVSTPDGQRIRATELGISQWPPTVSPWQYRSEDPSVPRETEQYMPNLRYQAWGDVALTWIDDRYGDTPGDLGALVGVGSNGGSHVFDLDVAATPLIAHERFAYTGVPKERWAAHVGFAADPKTNRFAAAISKGDRVGTTTFQH